MSGDGVLNVFNHLLRQWLASSAPPDGEEAGAGVEAFRLLDLQLEPAAVRIFGRIDHPQAAGKVVLRLEVHTDAPGRYTLRLRPEVLPDRLGPLLEPLRDVLETAQGTLVLRFDDEGRTGVSGEALGARNADDPT